MNRSDANARLRARLRAGDPYRGETLPPADRARIAAHIREAATRQPVRRSGLLLAVAAGLATVVALAVWTAAGPGPVSAPVPATAPTPAPAPADPSAIAEARPVVPGPVAAEPVAAEPVAAEPVAPAAVASEPAVPAQLVAANDPGATVATVLPTPTLAPDRPTTARSIRFTAPRGTRIIWNLDPNFESSTTRNSAPSARPQGAIKK